MMKIEPRLLRVVYFSFQDTDGGRDMLAADIDEILTASQANNARCGITGALIFNAGVFGQVIEGPADAVEETFERIQMDDRHDSVTVLDSSIIEASSFAQWSMGFVGSDRMSAAFFGEIGRRSEFDISRLSGHEIFETLKLLTLKNEIASRAA